MQDLHALRPYFASKAFKNVLADKLYNMDDKVGTDSVQRGDLQLLLLELLYCTLYRKVTELWQKDERSHHYLHDYSGNGALSGCLVGVGPLGGRWLLLVCYCGVSSNWCHIHVCIYAFCDSRSRIEGALGSPRSVLTKEQVTEEMIYDKRQFMVDRLYDHLKNWEQIYGIPTTQTQNIWWTITGNDGGISCTKRTK
jgi:hypothetical protein